MVERLGTGIRGLDGMIKGGLPKGSTTLILGPAGTGKTTISMQFLFEGLRNGKYGFELLTSPRENLRLIAESFEWDQTLLEKLGYIDLFSWRVGTKSPFEHYSDPRQPSDVSIVLSRALEARKVTSQDSPRLVIDSLSDIILQVKDSGVINTFLQSIKQKLAALGVTTLVLLEQDVHDERTVAQAEFACDGTIVLRVSQEERQIAVKRMVATPVELKWIPYAILGGVDIKAESFFR